MTDLRKQTVEAFELSWLDQGKLWLAWRVIRKKVIPKMGNWRTTLIGMMAAVLTYAMGALQNGEALPQTSEDWTRFGLACAIAALGWFSKDSSVGSQPGDPPTKERIAGAIQNREWIKEGSVAEAADAERLVDTLAHRLDTTPTGI